jgi:transposase-like protein
MADDERIERMTRAYVEEGRSYAQIAEEYGITRQRVGQLLGPLGLSGHRRQARIAREQRLRAAHARLTTEMTTLEEEAEVLGYATGESLRAALYDLGLRVVRERPIPPHGTLARYRSRKYRCSCEACRRANSERQRELKDEEPPTHGYSGYINYGCRCQVCKEAHRVTVRMRRAAKRRKEVTI